MTSLPELKAQEALKDFKASVSNGEPLNDSTYNFICETLHEISCRAVNAKNIDYLGDFERRLKVKEAPSPHNKEATIEALRDARAAIDALLSVRLNSGFTQKEADKLASDALSALNKIIEGEK